MLPIEDWQVCPVREIEKESTHCLILKIKEISIYE